MRLSECSKSLTDVGRDKWNTLNKVNWKAGAPAVGLDSAGLPLTSPPKGTQTKI